MRFKKSLLLPLMLISALFFSAAGSVEASNSVIEQSDVILVVEILEITEASDGEEAKVQIQRVLKKNKQFDNENFRNTTGQFILKETRTQQIPQENSTIFITLKYNDEGKLTFAAEKNNIVLYTGDHTEMTEVFDASGNWKPLLAEYNLFLEKNRPAATDEIESELRVQEGSSETLLYMIPVGILILWFVFYLKNQKSNKSKRE